MYYKCNIQANYFVYIEEAVHDMIRAGGLEEDREIPCVLIDEEDIPENRRRKRERTGRFNGIPTKAELKPMKE